MVLTCMCVCEVNMFLSILLFLHRKKMCMMIHIYVDLPNFKLKHIQDTMYKAHSSSLDKKCKIKTYTD